jgi:regulatory protein
LSRREHSRAELMRKLQGFAEPGESIDTLLDALESEGWLSNARFVDGVVHRQAARFGASRIVGELRRHALDDELVDAANARLRASETARARAVWEKKFGSLPIDKAERAKQARFLAVRGFSFATIAKLLKGIEEDWPHGDQ